MVLSTSAACVSLLLLATSRRVRSRRCFAVFMVHFFNNAIDYAHRRAALFRNRACAADGHRFGRRDCCRRAVRRRHCAGRRGAGGSANRHRAHPVAADNHDGSRVSAESLHSGNATGGAPITISSASPAGAVKSASRNPTVSTVATRHRPSIHEQAVGYKWCLVGPDQLRTHARSLTRICTLGIRHATDRSNLVRV